MSGAYLNVVVLAEQLHRRTLQLITVELAKLGIADVNATQALMLMQLGQQTLSVGQLTALGCYLGTNVSYNVRRMSECGYLIYEKSPSDQRVIQVRSSPKGCALADRVTQFLARLDDSLAANAMNGATLDNCQAALSTLNKAALLHLDLVRTKWSKSLTGALELEPRPTVPIGSMI